MRSKTTPCWTTYFYPRPAPGWCRCHWNFYPRPPWGGRQIRGHSYRRNIEFLSTPSVGRATTLAQVSQQELVISIHALRGEGDCMPTWTRLIPWNFYPRPPWGGRPIDAVDGLDKVVISIHALRGEGDLSFNVSTYLSVFLSTPSVGRATPKPRSQRRAANISIHALRGEGDWLFATLDGRLIEFLSTPSVGRATDCLPQKR